MRSLPTQKILLLLLGGALCSLPAFSQSRLEDQFQHIDEENGLSNRNIQCIYKDSNDFMWIGTTSGLNLMDGSGITVFKNNPSDSLSISNNYINALAGGTGGLLWVGTRQGLNCLNPVLRRFTRIPLYPGTDGSNDLIISLAVDQNQTLWIATTNGLFSYNPGTKKMTSLPIPGDNYEKVLNNNITHIACDGSGKLWFTTFNGLWSYNVKARIFVHEINATNDPEFTRLFTTFCIGHQGTFWIGTWNKGLKEWNPVSRKVITHLPYHHSANINCIAEALQPDGKYLIWVNGTTRWFDPEKNHFFCDPLTPDPEEAIQVNAMYLSPKDRLWIGASDGLYFSNPRKRAIRHHVFKHHLTDQAVSLLEWGKKILVSGAGKYFLKAYDKDLNETDDFFNPTISTGLACLSLKYTDSNHLKCGTTNGIVDINLATHAFKLHSLGAKGIQSPTINFITSLFRDDQRRWWYFPWRHGIWKADSSGNQAALLFTNFLTDYNIPKPVVISDACEDHHHNLWLSDYDEGVILYNGTTHQFSKPFKKVLGEKVAVTQLILRKDTIYSFTGNSLLIWNVDSLRLRKIKLPFQLDEEITSIAFDSTGYLWIATLNGLLSYNFSTGIFNHFTTSDGLIRNEMDGTLYCLSDGRMIYGCPDFLSSFRPEKMMVSLDDIPKIRLSEVMVDGNPIYFDTSAMMDFNPEVNNFIFRWAVTDYSNPLNNRYFYRLKGIDKQWRSVGKKGEVEFANLSAGDYTLLLKGQNSNGIDADQVLQLRFQIRLPFWRTWWFLSLVILALAAGFYALYRYRYRQLLKIERLRDKISLDLHDDIGSTLSSISILSDIALHPKKEEEIGGMLREIKENSISLMERMDDIVWSINPRNDSLENLFLRIRSFAAKLFEAKEIAYKIEIGESIRHIHLSMEYRQHLYLIMKEAINNLIKYSECTSAAISAHYQAPFLTICVCDNGKGYDPQHTVMGNGIHSMKKRAKDMNALLEMKPAQGGGTAITLQTKIK